VELLDDGGCRACGGPVDGGALLVSCAGVPEAIQGSAAELSRIASKVGLSMAEVDMAERTWEALSDFPWVNASLAGTQPNAIWQGSVRPAECARAMRAIREATRECGQIAMTATVAHGILRGGIRSDTLQSIARGLLAARAALNALGGFLLVLDAPAPVRAEVDVWGSGPDALGVMQRMKAAFDSKAILNPGRFVGGI